MRRQRSSDSTIYFPLRTNVDWFVTPDRAALLARQVKQAMLLYDNLVFQSGLFRAWIGSTGGFQTWIPPDQVTDEMLQRPLSPPGGKHFLKFSGTVVLHEQTERAFKAEFHTLVDEFGGQKLPWVTLDSLVPVDRFKALHEQWARRDTANRNVVIEGVSKRVRRLVLENMNRDMMLASILGSAVSMDALHGPVLAQDVAIREVLRPEVGFLTLEVVVPDFSMLPWSEVIDLREDPAFEAFREKMVHVEARARECLPDGTIADVKYHISQLLLDESLREIQALRPRLLPAITAAATEATLDLLVPLPLQGLGALMAAGQFAAELHEWNQHRRSWIVVLQRLRPSSAKRSEAQLPPPPR